MFSDVSFVVAPKEADALPQVGPHDEAYRFRRGCREVSGMVSFSKTLHGESYEGGGPST